MEVLSSNQSNLILAWLICSITDIIWDFISSLAATDYLKMTRRVNKKALVATLDTVTELMSFSLMIIYQLLMFSYLRTLV